MFQGTPNRVAEWKVEVIGYPDSPLPPAPAVRDLCRHHHLFKWIYKETILVCLPTAFRQDKPLLHEYSKWWPTPSLQRPSHYVYHPPTHCLVC